MKENMTSCLCSWEVQEYWKMIHYSQVWMLIKYQYMITHHFINTALAVLIRCWCLVGGTYDIYFLLLLCMSVSSNNIGKGGKGLVICSKWSLRNTRFFHLRHRIPLVLMWECRNAAPWHTLRVSSVSRVHFTSAALLSRKLERQTHHTVPLTLAYLNAKLESLTEVFLWCVVFCAMHALYGMLLWDCFAHDV